MKKIVEIQFGSHLYGTDTENSDVDLKGIYIPDYKDILLQRTKASISNKRSKEHGEKNSAGEIDEEHFSLQRYLQLLSEGQTVALDMLFAPYKSLMLSSDLWEYIRKNRHRFISKKSAAFVGYCRQQANKYGIKGSRVAAVRKVFDLLSKTMALPSKRNVSLSYLISEIYDLTNTPHIAVIPIKQASGDDLLHLEVCGRKFGFTSPLKLAHETLGKILNEYGKRALLAESNDGVDWKALSHAVRVATQAIELFNTGFISFPLPNADHVLDIKLGKITYQEVANEIEDLLVKVEEAAAKSNLPDNPDYKFIDEIVLNAHFKEVINETNRA